MAHFSFEQFTFDSDTSQLQSPEGLVTLDPKIGALLHYFLMRPNVVITRDDLIENVWQGVIVSENSVNWSISQLRKALQDNPRSPTFIKTISKKGYLFQVVPTEQKHSDLASDGDELCKDGSQDYDSHKNSDVPQSASVAPNTRRRYVIGGGLAILIAVCAILYLVVLQPTPQTSVGQVAPLTTLQGRERGGDISDDSLLLAFLHSPVDTRAFHLYLKPLKENLRFDEVSDDGTVVKTRSPSQRMLSAYLLDGSARYFQAIWGESSYQLYAVRQQDEQCQIVELNLALDRTRVEQEKVLQECHPRNLSKIAFDKAQRQLFFTDTQTPHAPYGLYKVSAEGDVSSVLEAGVEGKGFVFLDIDSSNQRLLLLRDNAWRATDFMEYQITSGAKAVLFNVESNYFTAYWGHHPDTIWLNWGNDKVIEYEVNTKASHILLETAFGWNYDFHRASNNQVIFTVSDSNSSDLIFWQDGEWHKQITPFLESAPVYSSESDELLFISNQSGLPQVWQMDGNNVQRQISDAKEYREFHDISWSHGETQIVGVSERVVGMLDLDSLTYRVLLNNDRAPFFPKLSEDGQHLLVSHNENDNWSIFKYDLTGGAPIKSVPVESLIMDGFQFFPLNHSQIVFNKRKETGLWFKNLADESEHLLVAGFPNSQHWVLQGQTLYFNRDQQMWRMMLEVNDTTNEVSVADVLPLFAIPEGVGGQFSVNAAGDKFVFEDRRRFQSDLKIGQYQ